MYGGLGMSAPSLHRESTDSLISLLHVHERGGRTLTSCACMLYSAYGGSDIYTHMHVCAIGNSNDNMAPYLHGNRREDLGSRLLKVRSFFCIERIIYC